MLSTSPFRKGLLTALAATAAIALPSGAMANEAEKPRLVVITDIGTEPDDIQSMVRLLTYANDIEIEALLASTSRHLPDHVYKFLIEERVQAYREVLDNLRVHDPAYPDAEALMATIGVHVPELGMDGVGEGKDTDASNRIIAVVDEADERPVWVSIWGGAAPLAQALWTVRASRSPDEVARFVAKLRVYSISDQDDSGPWIRSQFPTLFWIASINGMTRYTLATWNAISGDAAGADPAIVSQRWLRENIRTHGPLGSAYPAIMFIMEGDTPAFLGLIPNGLNVPDRPDWGGWGGRYELSAPPSVTGLWSDAEDSVVGKDGKTYHNNKATLWRWREAFQNDFAMRMDWSITPKFGDANHAPQPVLNGVAGLAPVTIRTCPGDPVRLSAAGTRDPDGDALSYKWWVYSDVQPLFSPDVRLTKTEGAETVATVAPWTEPGFGELPESYGLHVILEVSDGGTPSVTRYRRAILEVPLNGKGCKPIPVRSLAHGEPTPGSTIEVVEPGSGGLLEVLTIGDIAADPAMRAVLDRHLPGIAAMAEASPVGRLMPLTQIKTFDPRITDDVLARIEAELAELETD